MKGFSDSIIDWYQIHKRHLPWRQTSNPYFIWISEIILQQTRVEQGTAYYQRFVKNFPSVKHLASASEEEVLKLWQGLGYYSRARNLHATAKHINTQLKGNFPSTYDELLKLKGVGRYTAAAIASFAFNKSHAVVDGNVFRVLSRAFGISTPIDTTKGNKEFYTLAEQLIDPQQPGTFNQAIMELGSLQCKPVKPDCQTCPIRKLCYAYEKKMVDHFPVKEKKTKSRDRFFNYVMLNYKDKIVLHKRTEKDIWKNLYDFPLIETASAVAEKNIPKLKEWNTLLKNNSYSVVSVSRIHKHVLSHQKIHARFWELRLNKPFQNKEALNIKEVKHSQVKQYAVPKLIELILKAKKTTFEA